MSDERSHQSTTKLLFVDFPEKPSKKEYEYITNVVLSKNAKIEDEVWYTVGNKLGGKTYRLFISFPLTVSDKKVEDIHNRLLMIKDFLYENIQ